MSTYNEVKGDMICEWIEEGMSLRDIEDLDDGFPKSTILGWLRDPVNETFRTKYARARVVQADAMDELILNTANSCTSETAAADRVKIDAYKWRAMKLKPDVYGDKVNLQNNGGSFDPVTVYLPSNGRETEKTE